MENRAYVFQQSHICLIGLICAFLSLFLLYFKNGIFESNIIIWNPKLDPCDGRYVYVYDLPSRFNEDMITECNRNQKWLNMCKYKYTVNGGFGKLLNNTGGVFSDHGWYDTNQFTVSVVFNNRMKRYKCVTKDASVAAAFYVPYYAGYDFGRYIGGFNVTTRDVTSIELVKWLESRDEWKINNGKDHFVVAGRITWDFRRKTDEDSDWGNKFLTLPAARNLSVLLIESSPSNLNDFAIPYPTYFHPSKDKEVFYWQDRMRKTEWKWLFCFVGAPRPDDLNSIRSRLINQCKNSSVGKVLECGVDDKKCHSPSNVMRMFQSSVFCLQPEGDSYTRRSAFDSILAGCIPVFFHPGSFYTQYTWHVPKNHTKYSVFIPHDDIRKNVSIEKRLGQIDPNTVKMMREEVINMIPRLIYADPDSKLETLEDAFDISLNAIIRKVSKLRQDKIDGRTGDELVEEYGWKYALLEQGNEAAVREWEPYFPKPKLNNGSVSDLINKQEPQS
ncbi:xyloglucan galactosyltransferase MUR3-like [Bidens hawaiensis]|uniref:xyloglucan galactosyltransferase MUR3-like n=1 Tax=Bidens hawaiensis TaxID=980011 RepID=UPI00404B16A5